MKHYVFALWDNKAEIYDPNLIVFPNQKIGEVQLRRSVREAFINKDISYDWVREHDYVCISDFDTENGTFDFSFPNHQSYPCFSMVRDLIDRSDINES